MLVAVEPSESWVWDMVVIFVCEGSPPSFVGPAALKCPWAAVRTLLKVGPTLAPRGGWVGGLVWFWAICPRVPTHSPGGGGRVWVGGWLGGTTGLGSTSAVLISSTIYSLTFIFVSSMSTCNGYGMRDERPPPPQWWVGGCVTWSSGSPQIPPPPRW